MTKIKNILNNFFGFNSSDLEWNYKSGKSIEEQRIDLGAFQYTSEGFTYTRGDFIKTLKWADITQLNVFKKDLMTIDEICMEIVYGDNVLEISEEIPGWYQFVNRIKDVFPIIPKAWDFEIINPAFVRNYRTIYTKAAEQTKT